MNWREEINRGALLRPRLSSETGWESGPLAHSPSCRPSCLLSLDYVVRGARRWEQLRALRGTFEGAVGQPCLTREDAAQVPGQPAAAPAHQPTTSPSSVSI